MNNDKLFTFILEYRGTTYLSQVESKSISEAPISWARSYSELQDGDMTSLFETKFHEKLINSMESDEVVAVTGMRSMWCVTPSKVKETCMIHFVETVA